MNKTQKLALKDKKIIIFDMDGTLINSVGVWNEVDAALIDKINNSEVAAPDEAIIQKERDDALRLYSTEANPYLKYAEYLKKRYHAELEAEDIIKLRYEIADDYLKHKVDYKKDADVFLKQLKRMGFTLVIATTTKKTNMDIYRRSNVNILAKAPLDEFFDLIYTREAVQKIKPDPQVHYLLMQKLNVVPQQCLVFEDSLVGVEAAKRAGIEVAAVYDKYSAADMDEIKAQADYYFADFAEVVSSIY